MYNEQGPLTIDLAPAIDLDDPDTSTLDAIQDAIDIAQRNIAKLQDHFGSPTIFAMSIERTQAIISRTERELKSAIKELQQLKTDAEVLEQQLVQAHGE